MVENNSCWVKIYANSFREPPRKLEEIYDNVKEVRRVAEASEEAQIGQDGRRICSVKMESANDDEGWLELIDKWRQKPVKVVVNISEK